MERIKQRRLQQMKKAQEQRARWKADGHGEYREIVGEKEFFKEMKGVERMVAHFYRENWPCKVMDKHLDLLAKKHLETKFVKVHAQKFRTHAGSHFPRPRKDGPWARVESFAHFSHKQKCGTHRHAPSV